MIKFFLERPIGVCMSFLAFALLGLVSLWVMPITLMPDINIPRLRVKIIEPSYSTNELENLVTKPIRKQLLQIANLDEIKSETSNGIAYIDLNFNYGVDIDYAFIEVADNLDKIQSSLPSNVKRPILIKFDSSDIPLFFINIPYDKNRTPVEFSKFINKTVRKRIEQIESVSHVDLTGLVSSQIEINPKAGVLDRLNISINDISKVINENNTQFGAFKIKDGHYLSNVVFEPVLKDLSNIENLYVNTEDGSYQIKNLADVSIQSKTPKGYFYNSSKRSISLAVFNRKNTKIYNTKDEVIQLLSNLSSDHSNLKYSITEDQSSLLKLSVNSLFLSILSSAILSILITFLFLRKYKLALMIGIVIPVSVVTSFIFLNSFGITINVISLSGLIVGIGMIIDNSLIVIDNITQFRVKGNTVIDSCLIGVLEVVKPLLASLLTTSSVFIPLIFLSGVPGVLFYDQAISIIVSLSISYIVSIVLLPTLYTIFNEKVTKVSVILFYSKYIKSFNFFFKKRLVLIALSVSLVILSWYSFSSIGKEKLPLIHYDNFNTTVNWNEPISLSENVARSLRIDSVLKVSNSIFVGEQGFLFPIKGSTSSIETSIYTKSESFEKSQMLKDRLSNFLNENYSNSIFSINNAENIFEQIFPEDKSRIEVKVPLKHQNRLDTLFQKIEREIPNAKISFGRDIEKIKLLININKLTIYKVNIEALIRKLKSVLVDSKVSVLKTTNEYLPIVIKGNKINFISFMENIFVLNNESIKIPIKNLVSIKREREKETIYSDNDSYYIPVLIETNSEKEVISLIKNELKNEVGFEGSYFDDTSFVKELQIVFFVTLLLLYLILAIQFESLLQPFIVLSEIPLTLGVSVIIMNLLGITLNVMSMIGLIVVLGIVINDSILKIDAINKLRFQNGMSIIDSIHYAGKKRLNAILMTSLTTIFAMVPIFLSSGIGADIQKPLAIVVIVSMIIGTVVSLYFVPIIYWYLAKTNQSEK